MGDIKINPHLLYAKSADASAWGSTNSNEAVDVYYLGVSVDYAADMFSAWFTGILASGTVEMTSGDDLDVAAYLSAGDATGDENPTEVGAILSLSF
jgi:hypothetical protein